MSASLDNLLRSQYGVRTRYISNPLTSAVGVTVTKICPIRPNRVGLTVTNMGATTIYLSPENDVSATKGIILPGGGTTITFRWDIDMHLVASDFYALSSAAGGLIYVLENVIYEEVR